MESACGLIHPTSFTATDRHGSLRIAPDRCGLLLSEWLAGNRLLFMQGMEPGPGESKSPSNRNPRGFHRVKGSKATEFLVPCNWQTGRGGRWMVR